jgi:integrase
LEWERIDLTTSRITLYRTKSGKPRGVPMNSAVYDALVALEPGANGRHGRPFQRKSGGAWGQIRTAFETAMKRADIREFRFHDLRHLAGLVTDRFTCARLSGSAADHATCPPAADGSASTTLCCP